MSVELGPGLIGSIFDGIQRPLDDIMKVAGNNLSRGVEVPSLKRDRKWRFEPRVKVGDQVKACDIIGTVQETDVVVHKIMVPNGVEGEVTSIHAGEFTVTDTVCTVKTAKGEKALTLMQRWPVRRGRPYRRKLSPDEPLITGQRVIDCLFPLPRAAWRRSRAHLAAAKRSHSISLPNGRRPILWFISAAASVAMR